MHAYLGASYKVGCMHIVCMHKVVHAYLGAIGCMHKVVCMVWVHACLGAYSRVHAYLGAWVK